MYAGIAHLTTNRIEFQTQVPKLFASQVGLVAAIFFIAVFPGNISQYLKGINAFGLGSDRARAIRLLFQPLLVVWAIWSTGAWVYVKQLRGRK